MVRKQIYRKGNKLGAFFVGKWEIEKREKRKENREKRKENREWRMENGEWRMEDLE